MRQDQDRGPWVGNRCEIRFGGLGHVGANQRRPGTQRASLRAGHQQIEMVPGLEPGRAGTVVKTVVGTLGDRRDGRERVRRWGILLLIQQIERPKRTLKTLVGQLITQRSQVQILPPLPGKMAPETLVPEPFLCHL